MSYQIDHVFVLTTAHLAAAQGLQEAGFAVALRRDHPGQGTANVCIHMENGYVELLWVDRRDEVVSPLTRPTGLDERSRWTETSASPIGIALRGPADAAPPFPCRSYRPKFLPGDTEILIADEPVEQGAPLVFLLPPKLKGHDVEVAHTNRTRRMTSIEVACTIAPDVSPALTMLQELGLCDVAYASRPALHVDIDRGGQGRMLDLNPQACLTLAW